MQYTTEFRVKEKYEYLSGFGSYHSSEVFKGANPLVNNSPQKPPYNLHTERLSGTSFVAPRHANLQTWMYRATSSYHHTRLEPWGPEADAATIYTPNWYSWPSLPKHEGSDWLSQRLLTKTGDQMAKTGLGVWWFNFDKDMDAHTAFCSLDGDQLVIPQVGSLDLQTELGNLLVRQNEIAVIPRGIKFRVTLPDGPVRGLTCELFQGHFQLPELGIVGSTGLANPRDFQVPVAAFDGSLENNIAKSNNADWTVFSRQSGRLWRSTQNHTPFDVAAWHGTFYPYKFDLARFNMLENSNFDEHDPTLFTILTVPSAREIGSSVIDVLAVPPRWKTAQDTLRVPYFHRNAMTEFFFPIVANQDKSFPLNNVDAFVPFAAGLAEPLATHGPDDATLGKEREKELVPEKVMNDGLRIGLFETELPMYLTQWASDASKMHKDD